MKQDTVLQILKQKNAELTSQFGVKSLLLFGSVACKEATSASDVDLLVEFSRIVGYFGLFALQHYLENLLGCPVDLGTPDNLKPYIKERVMEELICVTQRLQNRIRDILDAIAEIQSFTSDLDYATFQDDNKAIRAIEMNFIIIGEVANPRRN